MPKKPSYRYVGGDPNWSYLPGIPARDLTAEDIAELAIDVATLDASPLYQSADFPAPARTPASDAP